MRYDHRYTRVFDIITHEAIPRLRNGGVALCQSCQRTVMFSGGFIEHLIRILVREARYWRDRKKALSG